MAVSIIQNSRRFYQLIVNTNKITFVITNKFYFSDRDHANFKDILGHKKYI